MQVTVQFFGHYGDLYTEPLFLSVPENATVREVVAQLVKQDPRLSRIESHCRFALDTEYAHLDDKIPPDSLLAVLPPMSGG